MMTSAWVIQGFGGGGGSPLPIDTIISPASIIAQYLVDQLVVSSPANAPLEAWPVYINGMPATGSPTGDGSELIPNEVVSTYDTAGVVDSKDMTGTTWEHEGVEIMNRCLDPSIGYGKMRQIKDVLSSAAGEDVDIGAETWRIINVNRTTGIASLGQDPDTAESLFSLNLRVSIRRIV